MTLTLNGCHLFLSQDKLVELAANLVIEKYQTASCEEVAQMQPTSGDTIQGGDEKEAALKKKAIELLKNNPELREQFINRVAGPMANKMFECDLVP
ncbi:MAG: hypothetical protein F6J87_09125 [Spirulina sp. SIO3F2]|nr:hypothetical protein [Spirulina sp. SIO3F2]